MRVIAKRTLREFWQIGAHGDSRGPLEAWHAETQRATWLTPQEVKGQFRNASILRILEWFSILQETNID